MRSAGKGGGLRTGAKRFFPRALGAARAGPGNEVPHLDQDNLLRQVAYEGLHHNKPANEVRRHVPDGSHLILLRGQR